MTPFENLYIQFASNDGGHATIRKWSQFPFAGGVEYALAVADTPAAESNLVGNGELRSAAMHLIGVLRANRRWINNSLAKDEIIAMDNAVEAVRAALASEGQAE